MSLQINKVDLLYEAKRQLSVWEEDLHRLLSDNFPTEISCKYEWENEREDYMLNFIWITDGWAPSLEQLNLLSDFGFQSLRVLYNDRSRKYYDLSRS